MISRRAFLKQTAAAGAALALGSGLGPAARLLATVQAEDDLGHFVGAPAVVTHLAYDPDAGALGLCTELPLGPLKAAQLGQAGFGLQLTVSYLSGGSP
ncbi:MAG: twin-arginine translocation signal domain-containing protein, partial [Chloroflexota bacterium]